MFNDLENFFAPNRRLESVVSGDTFVRDTNPHGGSDRANKQLQQLQTSLQALEQQHVAACSSNRSLADQLHKMEQRMQQLEAQNTMLQQQGQQLQQQLGSPPSNKHSTHRPSSTAYLSIMGGGVSTAEDAGQAAPLVAMPSMPGGKSMAARLTKLEQQVDALTTTATAAEVRTSWQVAPAFLDPKHCKQWRARSLTLHNRLHPSVTDMGHAAVSCNRTSTAHHLFSFILLLVWCCTCWMFYVLQERLQSATSAVQALDDEVSKQLHYIRADVKQAMTVANSQLQADVEAAAQARQQEDAAHLKAQLKGETEQHVICAHDAVDTLYLPCGSHANCTGSKHVWQRLPLLCCAMLRLYSLHVCLLAVIHGTCAFLAGLTSELDALVASSQRTMILSLTAEMERRAAAAQEASGVWESPRAGMQQSHQSGPAGTLCQGACCLLST